MVFQPLGAGLAPMFSIVDPSRPSPLNIILLTPKMILYSFWNIILYDAYELGSWHSCWDSCCVCWGWPGDWRFDLRFVWCVRGLRGGSNIYFEFNVVYMCVCVGLEIGHICWKLVLYDGCALLLGNGLDIYFGTYCMYVGIGLRILHLRWMDCFIVWWMWAGDLAFSLEIMFCMLGHGLGIGD